MVSRDTRTKRGGREGVAGSWWQQIPRLVSIKRGWLGVMRKTERQGEWEGGSEWEGGEGRCAGFGEDCSVLFFYRSVLFSAGESQRSSKREPVRRNINREPESNHPPSWGDRQWEREEGGKEGGLLSAETRSWRQHGASQAQLRDTTFLFRT